MILPQHAKIDRMFKLAVLLTVSSKETLSRKHLTPHQTRRLFFTLHLFPLPPPLSFRTILFSTYRSTYQSAACESRDVTVAYHLKYGCLAIPGMLLRTPEMCSISGMDLSSSMLFKRSCSNRQFCETTSVSTTQDG